MDLYLDKDKSPHIVIGINSLIQVKIDCIIDTGFSGGLSLPQKYKYILKGEKSITFLNYQLGDGTSKMFEIFNLKVKFKNTEKKMAVFFTDCQDAMVGIEFLTGFKFTLDLKESKINLD
ncbi:MAG: hypothetical protein AAB540_01890 [Patescibacteria group bacterium]